MNEDQFNADLRAFLKRFGVTAQREIERAVHQGIEAGTLTGSETLKARASLELEGVTLNLVIEEPIRLA
ncbi:MAG: hypothetical protein H0X37_00695 [Herpetosiphonaceae bacterium]|nr:hypothetical protein [Herpetosiphonaceae bacterium]